MNEVFACHAATPPRLRVFTVLAALLTTATCSTAPKEPSLESVMDGAPENTRRQALPMARDTPHRRADCRKRVRTGTHDAGFMPNRNFGNGTRVTGDERYEEVLTTYDERYLRQAHGIADFQSLY